MTELDLMESDYSIVDGGDVPTCTQIDPIQWTYNNGQFLAGSAYMYNYVFPSTPFLIPDKRGSILER
jgi:Glycosyl hydrolase family 76